MYAEMLAEGMVPDESQRRGYLATLRTEAVRLTHMVENVLAYARLERGRTGGRVETLPVGQLVHGIRDRLACRAEQAGMKLVVAVPERAGEVRVRTNPSAAEQVLFNLVNNACKYAAGADDKRIHLRAEPDGSTVALRVADHGPGLPPTVRRRLFEPFSKSAEEAAGSAPGVGLGLALSRRLARDMGGDLRLEHGNGHVAEGGAEPDGACFVLSLPTA
jgi:signal transduction histidine kinase